MAGLERSLGDICDGLTQHMEQFPAQFMEGHRRAEFFHLLHRAEVAVECECGWSKRLPLGTSGPYMRQVLVDAYHDHLPKPAPEPPPQPATASRTRKLKL